jgi:hypothetical protein
MDTVTLHPPAGFSLRLLGPAQNPDSAADTFAAEDKESGFNGSQDEKVDGSSALDAALMDAWNDPEVAKAQSTDKASQALWQPTAQNRTLFRLSSALKLLSWPAMG